MRKIVVPVLVMVFILSAGLLAGTGVLTAQESSGPKIVVKEARYDLGKVEPGKTAAHVFEVRNEGTATLIIERVQPG